MAEKIEKPKGSFYYLMEDILINLPINAYGLYSAVNHNHIAKATARRILSDETKKSKPKFKLLNGALTLQNDFLRQMPQIAIYEITDIIPALKICFNKTGFKIIKKLSAEVIVRLFIALYLEFVMISGREEGKVHVEKFKKYFSIEDVVNAMKTPGVYHDWILERHGFRAEYGENAIKRRLEIINKFYEK